jgi:hypothetical protein
MVSVDPVDLVKVSVSSGSESECFVPAGSNGSLSESESDNEFAARSSATSDVMVFNVSTSLVSDPHEPLVGPKWVLFCFAISALCDM